MRYMNDYDIHIAARTYAAQPNLTAAIQTLDNLRQWADENSDGWAYWPKPVRAASKLMELIEGDGTNAAIAERRTNDISLAALKKALAPVRAFRTSQRATFAIVEP